MIADDDRVPVHALARNFAERAAGWAHARGAPPAAIEAVRDAAYHASRATADGHVCLPLGDLALAAGAAEHALRERLLASHVVGTPHAAGNLPLVLDDGNRLYLHRYFDYERRLAQRLHARAAAPLAPVPPGLRAQLDALFAINRGRLGEGADWQKIAVAMAMLRPLTIISGGPGTGKTATVVSLLACLLEQQPACRIALAAPTGKAATRMLEAIRGRAHDLAPHVAARVPTDAFTIHRLLGVSRTGDTFRHHAGHPLPLDVLVVDEASMLDLALAARLLEAVSQGARVVLLGDKDQLAAVETGAVFAEVCADPSLSRAMIERLAAATGIAAEAITPAPVASPPRQAAGGLRDCVVWLVENFRFGVESGIGQLAARVNAGDADAAMAWLRESGDPSVSWIEDAGRAPAPVTMACIEDGYRPYVDALRARRPPEAVFDAFDRFRVLCAEREGPRGVAGMNDAIAAWFRGALDHPVDPGGRSPWYPGRPVMLLGNDYALRLFNGDIGIVLPSRDGTPQVVFRDAAGELRHVPPGRLPAHETAFASTVHKAQGNEHDAVVLVLPARASAVVGRALLYTAVTRARERCTIASPADVLAGAIRSVSARHTGLQAQWAGLAAG